MARSQCLERYRPWHGKTPTELLAAYEAVLGLLEELDIWVGHSTIHKERLQRKYGDSMSPDAYLFALQFSGEKIDSCRPNGERKLRILIADEAKQHRLNAIDMVTDMQEIGAGRVLGRWQKSPPNTVIDSMHFVDSARSPGVQLADMVTFIRHRNEKPNQGHPDADGSAGWLKRLESRLVRGAHRGLRENDCETVRHLLRFDGNTRSTGLWVRPNIGPHFRNDYFPVLPHMIRAA